MTETQERAAAIAQDIMLVPRTVYVPYVAQTPIAPVRVASSVAQTAVRREVTEERQAVRTSASESARAETRAESRSDTSTQELLGVLRSLNDRLDRIERDRVGAPAGPACPPAPAREPAPFCPTSGEPPTSQAPAGRNDDAAVRSLNERLDRVQREREQATAPAQPSGASRTFPPQAPTTSTGDGRLGRPATPQGELIHFPRALPSSGDGTGR